MTLADDILGQVMYQRIKNFKFSNPLGQGENNMFNSIKVERFDFSFESRLSYNMVKSNLSQILKDDEMVGKGFGIKQVIVTFAGNYVYQVYVQQTTYGVVKALEAYVNDPKHREN